MTVPVVNSVPGPWNILNLSALSVNNSAGGFTVPYVDTKGNQQDDSTFNQPTFTDSTTGQFFENWGFANLAYQMDVWWNVIGRPQTAQATNFPFPVQGSGTISGVGIISPDTSFLFG